ncbi:PhoH family protein [Oxalobacter sp. OttesenSCG-928-P03]|nr:PhoH family protein [Oxalobacter sp. OttesenSCG-928-P03]
MMANANGKKPKASRTRKAREQQQQDELPPLTIKKAPPLEPRNTKQRNYINAIKNFQVTFGIGPAGTGKTYIAGAIACDMLLSKSVEKIIITRPAVEAGEFLGFLPGELEEKYAPYLAAFYDVLHERLGKAQVEYMIKSGRIEAIPFAYMRGRTFKNCLVILDEAQNATAAQMKLFLTRIGDDCKVIIDGDASQTDIPNSGLMDAIKRISYIPTVKVVEFSKSDVVRSSFVSEVITAYDNSLAKAA